MDAQTNLLIDGDVLIYRCGFAVEKTKYLVTEPLSGAPFEYKDTALEAREAGGVVWSRKELEPVENALYLVDTVIEKMRTKFPNSRGHIFLTPSVGNFRERIAVTFKYKGNRDQAHQPTYKKAIQTHLIEKYGAKYAVGQEADDELGIGASVLPNPVIVSNDKDLLQVPGRHYNWVKEVEINVGKKEGTLNFYSQVLSGDPTDNIFGLPGIGPVKASKMLSDCASSKDCWEVVRSAYSDNGGLDRALENARLCWIRRKPDEIWEPPA